MRATVGGVSTVSTVAVGLGSTTTGAVVVGTAVASDRRIVILVKVHRPVHHLHLIQKHGIFHHHHHFLLFLVKHHVIVLNVVGHHAAKTLSEASVSKATVLASSRVHVVLHGPAVATQIDTAVVPVVLSLRVLAGSVPQVASAVIVFGTEVTAAAATRAVHAAVHVGTSSHDASGTGSAASHDASGTVDVTAAHGITAHAIVTWVDSTTAAAASSTTGRSSASTSAFRTSATTTTSFFPAGAASDTTRRRRKEKSAVAAAATNTTSNGRNHDRRKGTSSRGRCDQ
mmetsp:Transcript_2073/g.3798  ORF Transcript_2073/g.3798 Transcript_2073/m.3798 type:complete len:285 (+) Transcript_2073:556-1410(+)